MADSTPLQRKIVHVDMDAFYASVEQRDAPELRGRPVVVGGSPDSRGVVCAASYEARKFGVRSAMPTSRAARLCPDAVFLRPDFSRYRSVSSQIREIFLRHTDLVEPLSLDEAYLDVTLEKTGLRTATETAAAIRKEIRDELSLTASAGVAPNKFLAKIASDWKKPDGLFVIKPHQVQDFLVPLPVARIPGVGPATQRRMSELGIETVGQLRERPLEQLCSSFGRFGQRLWELSRGIDEHPVVPDRPRKSISNETTFERDLTIQELAMELPQLAEHLWRDTSRRNLQARTVTLKLKSSAFRTTTRRETVPVPIDSFEKLLEISRMLLERFSSPTSTRWRLAGIGLSTFDENDDSSLPQVELFDASDEHSPASPALIME